VAVTRERCSRHNAIVCVPFLMAILERLFNRDESTLIVLDGAMRSFQQQIR
jgi:hypothetical protein